MGTPGFAVPSLRALVESENDVVAVVTKEDKPQGRGRRIIPTPVKVVSEQYNIPVLQPGKIKTDEFYAELKSFKPDLISVAAYGKILPKNILDLPPKGCINVHGSILPKYRGAAPINWAIIRGETITGITTMLMDEGMDTGDMLLTKKMAINNNDTAETLSEKLSVVGAELLIETIRLLKEDKLIPVSQNDPDATYAPMLKKEDGQIDWTKPAEEINNLIRGTYPWPGAFTSYSGKVLKIYKASVTTGHGTPGEILKSDSSGLSVATGDGALDILELQIESGKRLPINTFLLGRKIEEGRILG
ncbi:methionyl-tRNA formyltransferase [Desulfobacterota bacterium AH_259_B03_O07]|nr:methionyl-tRNA formyltransferase [Desulfobacterota bacterium AH_259_B03_O07]